MNEKFYEILFYSVSIVALCGFSFLMGHISGQLRSIRMIRGVIEGAFTKYESEKGG